MNVALANQPDTKFALAAIAKKLKTRHIIKARTCGKLLYCLGRHGLHKKFVRRHDFSQECRRLLPFAFFRNVSVVASAKRKNIKQMRILVEVVAQPCPSRVVCRRKLLERRGSKLRMHAEKTDDFHRVHIADGPETSSPGISITVR